jgi:Xaa-Pro aminopeptidase
LDGDELSGLKEVLGRQLRLCGVEMNFSDLQSEQIDWKRLVELNVSRVKAEMEKEGVKALLACTIDNWRYLTGLPVPVSLAYYTANLAVLSLDVDFPVLLPLGDVVGYVGTIAPWFTDVRLVPFEGTREARQPLGAGTWMKIIADTFNDLNMSDKKIAFDPATPFCWKDELRNRLPRAEIVDGGNILRRARLIKNEEEQKAIRRACVIGEIGIQAGLEAVEAGRTEVEVAAVVEYTFRAHGGEAPIAVPFVMAGDYPALGLLGPTHKVIRQGDLVRVDSGCSYGGYFSDFSRSVFVGDPDDEVKNAYEAVREALMAGAKAVKPGVKNTDLHRVINDTLKKASQNRYELGWFVGHGLGVGIHEDPMIGRKGTVEEFVMQPGMYFCMEPAIVVKGMGMIGLEDDYLVTEDGVEILTHTEFHL